VPLDNGAAQDKLAPASCRVDPCRKLEVFLDVSQYYATTGATCKVLHAPPNPIHELHDSESIEERLGRIIEQLNAKGRQIA
jgi:hypothetical protein